MNTKINFNSKNILILTSVYPQPDDSGVIVTPTVQYIAEKWSELGHRVIVIHNSSSFPIVYYLMAKPINNILSSKLGHIILPKETGLPLQREENGVKIYRLPMKKYIPHKKYSDRKIHKQLNKIYEILESDKFIPDIVVGHWLNPQLDLLELLGEYYGCRTSLVFHGDCSSDQIKEFNIKEKVKKISAIGCRNKHYAEYVQKALGLPKLPFICYSGVPDEQVLKAKGEMSKTFSQGKKFLYVGRLVKYKNVDTIIKALALAYPSNDYKLEIIGEGAEKDNLIKLSEELGNEESIKFYGQIPREKVLKKMKNASCFTMVSTGEVFGMVYIEAMLCGCLTIASKGGGIDGVIKDGKNGFLVEPRNEMALAEVFRKISKMDKESLARIRREAKYTAFEFSDSAISKRYLHDIENW